MASRWAAEQMRDLGLVAGSLPHASRAGTNPEPLGKPGGPGLFHVKGLGLPVMIEHVRNDLMQKRGMPEARATEMAIGVVRDWAHGHDGKGHPVHPNTVAQAQAAIAEYDRDRAKAKATRSTTMANGTYDADGLDQSWDGDHSDLPQMTGMSAADFDQAAQDGPGFEDWLGGGDAQRAKPKLGTGTRFANLKASLAGKGVKDPGALAAKIGRAKYGKGKFTKLASAARKKGAPAMASRSGELFRTYPLEDIHIMSRGEGEGSGRVVEAYAAVFGQPAEIHDHEGHYEEEIHPNAFDQAIRAAHPDYNGGHWRVACLYNHGMTVHGTPAERFSLPLGVVRDIQPVEAGLLTRTEYAETPLGEEILELVRMGAIRSQSFTGGIVRSNPGLRGPGDRYRSRGGVLTRVQRLVLGLREFGPTPFAAYTGAEVLGVRMQLPGSFEVDETDYPEFAEGDGPDGPDAAGDPPGDGDAARSTGNRLYQLRTEELMRKAGIELPH